MKRPHPFPGRAGAPPEFFSRQVSEERRFYLDLNPPANKGLTVVCGGVEHTTPDYAIHRANFPFFAVEYVTRGRGTVKLGKEIHSLLPGRLFAYGPGIRQDIESDPASPLVKYFVAFTGGRARRLLRMCGLGPGSVSGCFPPNELQAVFDELINCGLRHTPHSAELCAQLLECLALKIADSRAPLIGSEAPAFNTYQKCHHHIQEHFRRLKSLEEVGAECCVSNAHLCRLFRRFDHQSPYQYLLRLKMNLAADLLQQPGAMIKQVAAQAGFGDPFHFSRAFKSVFGMSPDVFRKWH
jgi:AraC-like DNA-binding protein/quercetin dioxygenase-like cupin family protein